MLRSYGAAFVRYRNEAPVTELPEPEEPAAAAGGVGEPGTGSSIGNYRLLQLVGEGGFGAVWSAQQEAPIRRRVAVKILKLGMDTKQVLARFETERQALAVMDHPAIAKVLDGGATRAGRPYFVMELVEGVPITRFCDDAKLSPRQRLELFRSVCSAVQHAHQKGIVHRDLKPSNILVGLQDGNPHPKIIDFGIAKAVSTPRNEQTMVTQFGQMLGTPEYMAPEQAETSGLDVDTRADVYSLGVILYELLTGTKPFELGTTLAKGYAELIRIIREVDPPKPSTRIGLLGEDGDLLARQRGSSRVQLGRALRGDLDWIVMKAMEKDRSNRYETVAALSDDVERHLEDRPVRAVPPSAAHRVRKYVRRHRWGVAASAGILASLVAGLVVSLLGYREARAQRDAARLAGAAAETESRRSKEVVEILNAMIGGADPYGGKEQGYTLRELLDDFDADLDSRLTGDPEVEATVRGIVGRTYRNLGETEKAEKHLSIALDLCRRVDGPESAPALEVLVHWLTLLQDKAEYATAEAEARAGVAIAERIAPESALMAHLLYILGIVVHAGRSGEEGVPFLRRALELRERLLGPDHEQTGNAAFALAYALTEGTDENREEAEKLFHRRIEILRKASEPDHPNVAMALDQLGRLARERGDPVAAETYLRNAIDIQRRRLENDHPDIATSLCGLSSLRSDAGDFDQAEEMLTEAEAIYRRRLGEDHPDLGVALQNHAVIKFKRGDLEGAQRYLEEACAIFRIRMEPDHPTLTITLGMLATVQRGNGDFRGAEQSYRELGRSLKASHASDSPEVTSNSLTLAAVLTEHALAERSAERAREAESILREVVALLTRSHGPEEWRLALAESQLADALSAQEQGLEEARELVLRSWQRLSAVGEIPESQRAEQKLAALERIVRVLETSERLAPGSTSKAAIVDWKAKLEKTRLGGN
jgi:serine/threonine protein kinase/tetratricopeptide (TPR) repeat protein